MTESKSAVPIGRNLYLTALLLLCTTALLAPVHATEEAAETEQWQEVEVLIFRQWERGGRHAERWPTRASVPHYPLWQVPAGCEGEHGEELAASNESTPPSQLAQTETADAAQRDQEELPRFVCLPKESRQLGDEWSKIRRSGSYSQLYYAAWAQPELSEDDSIAVPVPFYWRPPTEQRMLSAHTEQPHLNPPAYGLVRIFTKRFIHAVVNLRMHRSASGAQVDQHEKLRAPLHAMHQNRRMRGGNLYYLDHPTLGVLIVVRPTDGPPLPPEER